MTDSSPVVSRDLTQLDSVPFLCGIDEIDETMMGVMAGSSIQPYGCDRF